MAIEFAPPKWAVPGVLSECCDLLPGPPKVGKSWMSLGLVLDVAIGGKAFGAIDVDPGRCSTSHWRTPPAGCRTGSVRYMLGGPSRPASLWPRSGPGTRRARRLPLQH